MTARKPDYKLKVLNKKTDKRLNDAGAAWKNNDGSITIVLNPCVVLQSDSDLLINLFPADFEGKPLPKRLGPEEDKDPF